MARSKVKSRSHHDVLPLYTVAIVPTQYQLPTPYSFRDMAQTRFYRSRSLRQGQRSSQDHAMMLHTYTASPMSLPSINFLHPMVAEIETGKDFIGQSLCGKIKGQIKVTP